MSLGNLKGVAFITGAGSGIGREVSIAFAHCGAKLILVDVSLQALQETKDLCNTESKNVKLFELDISDDKKLVNLIQSIPDMHDFGGRLDYAINCAGIGGRSDPIAESNPEIDNRVIKINLEAQATCVREQVKLMLKQDPLDGPSETGRENPKRARGCIVNIASAAGFRAGSITGWAYVATKHGVIGLTKSAAVSYAKSNIRVNAVAPGVIRTAIWGKKGDEVMNGVAQITPVQRPAEAYEVADNVLYLCSDRATFVNGAIVSVDGALMAA